MLEGLPCEMQVSPPPPHTSEVIVQPPGAPSWFPGTPPPEIQGFVWLSDVLFCFVFLSYFNNIPVVWGTVTSEVREPQGHDSTELRAQILLTN